MYSFYVSKQMKNHHITTLNLLLLGIFDETVQEIVYVITLLYIFG